MTSTLEIERRIIAERETVYIAGLDEAGRGALAGPVVAAAVILPLASPRRLKALAAARDSKQLTPRQRERLYALIIENALSWSVGSVPAAEIDRLGIMGANWAAMLAAVGRLDPPAHYLLVDGPLLLKKSPLPQQAIVRGDRLSLSIAAASILAKVSRDRQMVALDQQYPQYGFARHKGYATPQHRAALEAHGPSPVHRYTFAPIRMGRLI